MSDDKREKLREYLRNNRPKNRANLGNNSNDKENSNKNLENDLNLNNDLNSDNSQISSSKNSNKRDYDKEPLIIRDYNMHETAFFAVILLLFFLFDFIFNDTSEFFTPKRVVFIFILLEIILELFKCFHKTIIFYNSKIVYKKGSDTALEINLNDIVGVYKTAICNENFQTQKLVSKKFLIGAILLVGITMIIFDFSIFLFVYGWFIAVFLVGKFVVFVLLNKKIGFKIYTSYLIKTEKNIINFLPKESYDIEIKRYFFDKINIDIEKAQCNFIVS
ncbi:hypothetical protein O6B96_00625 [Campylobacter ureolyticus]|uniref:hypothetical protein n=1 Tax=Campylobacter ureolyticus TaxID=827 RepID=UPI0022B44CEC|nr:hypothetical protein [Campylobacter ureolyticus]MCZ6149557.1 hypothetical protein [Campylobacter ureolyticus]